MAGARARVVPAARRLPGGLLLARVPRAPDPRPLVPRPLITPPGRSLMRIRQGMVFVFAVAATLGPSGTATACKVCDQFLHCITMSPGALTCVEGPAACALFMQCAGGGRKLP